MTTTHGRPALYRLRRTLAPWKPEETIAEAVDFARRHGVDELVWKIDTEEFSHGLPTLERVQTYLPWLRAARTALSAAGVGMSINPWATLGMRDSGLDLRTVHPEFDWMVGEDGARALAQACPLSAGWRRWLEAVFRAYAGTGPAVLWIEDDIRLAAHRPVQFGCFCEAHLRAFGTEQGRAFTREALLGEVLRPGAPSPVRAAWLAFQGRAVADACRGVAAAVHAVAPEVHVGLMCSAPWIHAMEGRDWDALLGAIAGPHAEVFVRPNMGAYCEVSPHELYRVPQLVCGTLRCVRRPVHAGAEVENWPFTRFAKSRAFTRAQMLLAAAAGCDSITLNLYDHLGSPLDEEDGYGDMLAAARPRLTALISSLSTGACMRGIGLLTHERGPDHKRLESGARYGDLSLGAEPWGLVLPALGYAVSLESEPVTAVSGAVLHPCTDAALDSLFSRGVLLDLSAAESLLQRGREDLIGARLLETFIRHQRATPAEETVDAEFGGAGGRYMTVNHLGQQTRIGRFEPREGARVVSRLVDPDRQPVQPGVILYENGLGGRVALFPYDLRRGDLRWFHNWQRQRQVAGILAWLGRSPPPLSVGGLAWPLPIRQDAGRHTVLAVLNLAADPYDGFTVEAACAVQPRIVHRLRPTGRWSRVSDADVCAVSGGVRVRLTETLAPLDMAVLRLTAPSGRVGVRR